ncbi:MAG: hypothetical protein H6560_00245 [Lewinellaceae bacterium]|nr:hypothetical protein [Lewinellaceae bacterium]
MLNLVNQILDLRKLEAGKMPLRLIRGDVLPFSTTCSNRSTPWRKAGISRCTFSATSRNW